MKRNRVVSDLILTGGGILTSAIVAVILAFLEKNGVPLYRVTYWVLVPVGALLSGFLAASGYVFAAAIVQSRRPTSSLFVYVLAVSVGTYFAVNFLVYSQLQVSGARVSQVMTFGQYLDTVIRNRRVMGSGPIGSSGYLIAFTQIIGFAAGGFGAVAGLLKRFYCQKCEGHLRPLSNAIAVSRTLASVTEFYERAVVALRRGEYGLAERLLPTLLPKTPDPIYKIRLQLLACADCRLQHYDLVVQYFKTKKTFRNLHAKGALPPAAVAANAATAGQQL